MSTKILYPLSLRCGFFEKASCVQFSVCASLSDLDHLRKTETEPIKVVLLDSNHQVIHLTLAIVAVVTVLAGECHGLDLVANFGKPERIKLTHFH